MGIVVKMFIDKFGREVTIESDHPLAVEQRKRDAAKVKSAPQKAPAAKKPAAKKRAARKG